MVTQTHETAMIKNGSHVGVRTLRRMSKDKAPADASIQS